MDNIEGRQLNMEDVVNVASVQFQQGKEINELVSASVTTVDDSFLNLIKNLDQIQEMEGGIPLEVLQINSEMTPSKKVIETLNFKYPRAKFVFLFNDDLDEFSENDSHDSNDNSNSTDINKNSDVEIQNKKWWQIWK